MSVVTCGFVLLSFTIIVAESKGGRGGGRGGSRGGKSSKTKTYQTHYGTGGIGHVDNTHSWHFHTYGHVGNQTNEEYTTTTASRNPINILIKGVLITTLIIAVLVVMYRLFKHCKNSSESSNEVSNNEDDSSSSSHHEVIPLNPIYTEGPPSIPGHINGSRPLSYGNSMPNLCDTPDDVGFRSAVLNGGNRSLVVNDRNRFARSSNDVVGDLPPSYEEAMRNLVTTPRRSDGGCLPSVPKA